MLRKCFKCNEIGNHIAAACPYTGEDIEQKKAEKNKNTKIYPKEQEEQEEDEIEIDEEENRDLEGAREPVQGKTKIREIPLERIPTPAKRIEPKRKLSKDKEQDSQTFERSPSRRRQDRSSAPVLPLFREYSETLETENREGGRARMLTSTPKGSRAPHTTQTSMRDKR